MDLCIVLHEVRRSVIITDKRRLVRTLLTTPTHNTPFSLLRLLRHTAVLMQTIY
jgi:hypothetical protein